MFSIRKLCAMINVRSSNCNLLCSCSASQHYCSVPYWPQGSFLRRPDLINRNSQPLLCSCFHYHISLSSSSMIVDIPFLFNGPPLQLRVETIRCFKLKIELMKGRLRFIRVLLLFRQFSISNCLFCTT